MTGRFITPLQVTPLDDGSNWELDEPLCWRWRDGSVESVPRGFVTDFASVPDLAFWSSIVVWIGLALLVCGLNAGVYVCAPALVIAMFSRRIDDCQQADAPAVFHDQDYRRQDKSKWQADANLYRRMRANGAPWLVCALYWLNLTLFAWPTWWSMSRK